MFPNDTDFDTQITLETRGSEMPEESPFYILFLGDWSGRENRSINFDTDKLSPIEIDRDNFEDVMKKLNVSLNLDFQDGNGMPLSLQFAEIDDFHPDKIFQQLPLFANLRDVRRRLTNSQTFNEAAREVQSWLVETQDDSSLESETINSSEPKLSSNDLLNQILGQSDEISSSLKSQTAHTSEVSDFIKKIVKPYLIQTDSEEQSKLLIIVDEVISDLMRKILHHPQFQALEAAWRGMYFLVRRAETDSKLKIFLLDISKKELVDNLKTNSDLTDTYFYQILFQKSSESFGSQSWAAVCGNYTFASNVDDVASLMRIAKIAADTVTPFISHVKPNIFGFDSFAETEATDNWKISEDSAEYQLWTMLRAMPEAAYLALALPRILARLPYGQKTEPTEAFYFEEFTSAPRHDCYLWSNPGFNIALLLSQTFSQFGWNISQNFFQDFNGLPFHSYQDGLESKTKPCSEIFMTQSNCERIMEQGLIPVISFKNDDKVRFGSFQSIAYPATLLKGQWM